MALAQWCCGAFYFLPEDILEKTEHGRRYLSQATSNHKDCGALAPVSQTCSHLAFQNLGELHFWKSHCRSSKSVLQLILQTQCRRHGTFCNNRGNAFSHRPSHSWLSSHHSHDDSSPKLCVDMAIACNPFRWHLQIHPSPAPRNAGCWFARKPSSPGLLLVP